MSIQLIPREMLFHTLSFLTAKDLLKIKSVCKEWNDIDETISKKAIKREFHDMVNRTTALFQKMTGKTVYEFVPDLNEKLELSKFTAKQLHEHFKNIPMKVQCCIKTDCCSSFISSDAFLKMHKIEGAEPKHYIHLSINFPEPQSIFHFPKDLFEIHEGEETAFPFQGRLTIFKAHQVDEKFEDAIESLKPAVGYVNRPLTYYVWQKDAKKDSLISINNT
ncbi:MAG TPA: F-box protein [Rhabdochlamydiaceae bacterium]|nr:F-box protein [Rhabdochlamydiaceae bacterium]HSX14243.1 F-box protein [Chlamydiales bacterium]